MGDLILGSSSRLQVIDRRSCRSRLFLQLLKVVFSDYTRGEVRVTMVGPSCDRVARCREKRQRRQLAIGQGLFKRPVFAASNGQQVVAGEMGQASQFSGGNQTTFTPKRANAYPERSYYGGPEHECPYCGAVFWFQERVKKDSYVTQRKIIYNLCCKSGKIDLKPYEKPPPILVNLLRFDGDARSKRFLKLIRSYNSLFAFTSFGAAIDRTINNGTAPYVFKINGVVHHRIGTLLPQRGSPPKFAQLYIHDTEHEASNRLGIFKDDDGATGQPEHEITMALLNMLDDHNKLVKAFRYARDRLEQEGDQKITLRLLGCNMRHDVQYNLPSSGEIAAIIVGDYTAEEYTYDVLVHDKECGLRRISCLHPSYMALQYPLLFPYGEHGFHLGIRYSDADDSDERKRNYVTHLEFVRRHMHYRLNEANPYTCYGRLSDQIVVDSYSTIEGSRLQFIADHQKELRFESVQGIADAIDKGLISADSVGGRKIVPASFTGGRRYHVMNYQDAMAICRVYGPPDLFVTFTCNTKWREIVDALPALGTWYTPHEPFFYLECYQLWLSSTQGNSIHAQIYPPLAQEIKPKIKEGSVYNLSCFVVRKSNRQYKPVSNDNMIGLTSWTKIDEIVEIPPAFPVMAYSLTPIEQIHSHVDDKEYYTDAIGVITSISSVTSQRSKGQQTASLKRTISICNAGGASVNVVLWGGQATLFPAEQLCKDGQTSPQIIVFVGTLVKKYADGLCLSGGSPCKWYINPDIPEAKMLMARARSVHKPIKWNEILASSHPVAPAAEEQKVSYIKYLHPFENKRKEFLVTVTIKKIDKKWWYNACRKCTHTAERHGDTYKCINTDCNTIGSSTQRYKLFLTAGDETGDTDFVLFGRIAQRLVKRPADILIAENPVGFMPDAITKLLERTFIWNVSFTKNTITTGNVCFQVNAIVGEIDTGNGVMPMSPGGSHQSSLMVSQGASSSLQNTPEKGAGLVLPTPLTPQGGKADTEDKATPKKSTDLTLLSPGKTFEPVKSPIELAELPVGTKTSDVAGVQKTGTDPGENASVLGGSSSTNKQENTARKRSRSSPNKATAKRLFTDADDGGHDDQGSAEDIAEPGSINV
ncbi:hypothetical protein U9M48_017199 [Paspalum notatum var. saurae]|uniref:Replication protein n=1 Tax=Paspalum notatum var. saurae TaxID=547442 RepID=A0AAQ3T7K9_PASNO